MTWAPTVFQTGRGSRFRRNPFPTVPPPLTKTDEDHCVRTKAFFDGFADAYAGFAETPLRAEYEWPAVRSLLPDVEDSFVLDVACGPGDTAALLADQGADVLGVDASREMVRVADPDVTETTAGPDAVPFYRRPLAGVFRPLFAAGFVVTGVTEPTPTETLRESQPALAADLERRPPVFLCLRAETRQSDWMGRGRL